MDLKTSEVEAGGVQRNPLEDWPTFGMGYDQTMDVREVIDANNAISQEERDSLDVAHLTRMMRDDAIPAIWHRFLANSRSAYVFC